MFVNWIFFRLLIVVALDYRKRTQMWKMWLPKPNRAHLLRHHPKAKCLNNCQTIYIPSLSGDLKRNGRVDEFFIILKFWKTTCFPLIFKRSIFLYYTDVAQSDMIWFFFYLTFCQFCFSELSHELASNSDPFPGCGKPLLALFEDVGGIMLLKVNVFANVPSLVWPAYLPKCRVDHLGRMGCC